MLWANAEKRREMTTQLQQASELNNYEIEVIPKHGDHRIVLASAKL
jgi:hypothetical protein